MNEEKLATELKAGGVVLDDSCVTLLIDHHDSKIMVDVPWETANDYAMGDIVKHAGLLLARMKTHSPKRLRVTADDNYFSITAVE